MVRTRPGSGGGGSDSGDSESFPGSDDLQYDLNGDNTDDDSGGTSGGTGPGGSRNIDQIQDDQQDTSVSDSGSDDESGGTSGGTGPGGSRNIDQIQDDQQDTGGQEDDGDSLEPAQPRDRSDVRDAQRAGQRRAQARADAFEERQRELATDDFRDVQEYSQRRAQARADAFQERQRELATDDFRDVQEFSQRRAEARAEQASERNQSIAEQLGVPASVITRGEDYTIEDGEVELTAEGRRTAIESQAVDEGSVGVRTRADEDNVFFQLAQDGELTDEQIAAIEERTDGDLVFDDEGNISGLEESIDIQTTEQLTFDDEGNLVDVQEFGETEAAEQAARQELEGSVPFVGEQVSDFAFGSRDLLQGAGEVSADVGQSVWEGGDIPGTDVNVGLEAGAEVTGDVAGLAQESGEFVLFGGDENARDVRQSTFDIVRGEEDETTSNLAEGVGENLALGAGDIARAGIELPETVATGAEVTGRGAAFAYQRPAEAPGAAAGATAGLAEQVATQAIENPVRTGGALIGSAGIMGGAARLSPRAGTATRVAIQPFEEFAGIGGYRATRAVAGERAAQRAFPNQEPLIFSEEAAIRAGQSVYGGLRNTGGRVASRGRSQFGRFIADESAQLRTPGAGLIQRTETETESDGDLGPDMGTFDRSDLRLYDPSREFGEQRSFRSVDPTSETSPSQQDIGEGIAGRGDPSPAREGAGTVEENFGQYLREQEAEQRQREAAFQQAQTTGTAGATGGPSFRYETEAEQRLEEAQRPQVLEGESELEGVQEDFAVGETTAEMEGQLESAQESTLRQDNLLERRYESAFDQAQRPFYDVDEDVALEDDREFDQPLELEAESDLEQELESELEQELETENVFEQETESEAEVELETETEFRPEFETETETETETEFELEQRAETRREVEAELFSEPDETEESFGFGFTADDEVFASGIASAEDVLGGNAWGDGDSL